MRRWSTALLAVVLLASNGCMFRALRKNVERIDAMALLGGQVSQDPEDDAPIVVVLLSDPSNTIVDSFLLDRPGSYFFAVPAGTYRIAAFVDRNRDSGYDATTEPATYYGAPASVPVGSGQKINGLDMRLPARPSTPLGLAISVRDLGHRSKALPPIHLGEIVTLDDPRFSAANGHLGLWQPVDFLFDVGAGFYFLEKYDPHKIPVLFVHGAGGNPDQWRYLAEHIDRKKFQPWFLYYPSGMDMDTIARGAVRWLDVLAERYELSRIVVVAHSMGGLVSRAIINRMIAESDGSMLATFVSISTPWGGHAAATWGLEQAPVVMPMWRDIAPGSAFLEALYETPLPSTCPYYLLFSYNGHSYVLDQPSDGVVAISSELAMQAQRAAVKVYGFDESHTSILRAAGVSETLNEILAAAVHQ